MTSEGERYKVCDFKPHGQVHKKKFKETTLQEPQYCSMSMATLNTHQDNIYTTAGSSGNDTIVHKVNNDTEKKHCNCKCQYLLALFAGVVVLVLAGCVAFLFLETIELKSQTASSQKILSSQQTLNDSLLLHLQQINQQFSTLFNQTQQLSDSNTMLQQQLTTLHNQTQQLSDSNTMLQQQLTTLHNKTQDSNNMLQPQLTTLQNKAEQLNDSDAMLQQQLITLYNQTQDSNIMLQQQLTIMHNQTQQLSDSNTMLQQQLTTLHNQTQQLSASNTMLQQQLTTLHNQTQQLSDSNTMLHQQHYELHEDVLGVFPSFPAVSCAALPHSSPSGYYWASNSNDSPTLVYCTMSCGTLTGGWMRVGFLDMTNSSHQCPSGLMERNDSPNIRTCVRNETLGGCTSVELSTANIQYSDVCGRITAYQVGSTDDFQFRRPNTDINSAYVDGVSLTHGNPRQHIWTFAAAGRIDTICSCCNESRPASVGSDFFCDSGNPMPSSATFVTFHSANPLWDGDECAADNECCPTDNPPYFLKTLPQPTTDDIEMRVCRDEHRINEDIAIETVEIYVQ